jgi:hypothetical protein
MNETSMTVLKEAFADIRAEYRARYVEMMLAQLNEDRLRPI